jgi:hypothetical protein
MREAEAECGGRVAALVREMVMVVHEKVACELRGRRVAVFLINVRVHLILVDRVEETL